MEIYIRFIADKLLESLGYLPIYHVQNPVSNLLCFVRRYGLIITRFGIAVSLYDDDFAAQQDQFLREAEFGVSKAWGGSQLDGGSRIVSRSLLRFCYI